MKSENYLKQQTDSAWEKLHSRLERDNLINNPQIEGKHFPLYKLITGVAAVLVAGWFMYVYLFSVKDSTQINTFYTVQNEVRSSALITTLQDGSTIYLAENTVLTYPEQFSKEKREVNLVGDAYFEVAGNKAHPFLIYTSHSEIEVIGTTFEIRNPHTDVMELSVLTGEVKVSFIPAKGEERTQQASRYVRGGESITLSSGGDWEYMSGTKSSLLESKVFRFKNEPVKDIIRVMNKSTRQEEFIAIVTALENERLTVDFSNQTLEEVAEVLSLAVGGSWKRENKRLFISD